jgi:hypothetical protein
MFIELASRTIVSLHQVKVVNIHNDSCITIKYFNNESEITVTYNHKILAQADYKKIKGALTELRTPEQAR